MGLPEYASWNWWNSRERRRSRSQLNVRPSCAVRGEGIGWDGESLIGSQTLLSYARWNPIAFATNGPPSRSAAASRLRIPYGCYLPSFAELRCVDFLTISSGGSRIALGFGVTLEFMALSTSRAASAPIRRLCWSTLERGTRNESS